MRQGSKYQLLGWVAVLVAGLWAAPLAAQDGQADLDKATQLKLQANTLRDLEEVAKLCESALNKGLDNDGQQFAKQLLAATLFQRAERIAEAIQQQQQGRQWEVLRDLAVQDLEKVIKTDEQFGEAYLLLARMLALPGGDRDRAREVLEKSLKLYENDPQQKSMALMIRAQLQEQPADILADLDQALETAPNNLEALQIRALLLLQQKEYDRAVADLKRLLEEQTDNLGFLLALAEALANQEKFEEAIQYVDKLIEIQPEEPFGYTVRSRIRQQQNDLDGALEDLNKALKLEPRDLNALLLRARLHYDRNEFAEAGKDLERILQEQPDAFEAVLLRSAVHAAQGDFAKAVADVQRLLQIDPDNVPLQVQLGLYESANDRPRRAIEIFEKALNAEPENTTALRGRADALLAIGKHAEALRDYAVVVEAAPDNSGALNNYAWVLATSPDDELRDGQRALELAKKACELTEYKEAHILSTLASAYAETGDFENAIKWSEKAVAAGQGENREQLQAELDSYRAGKPWRERQETPENQETSENADGQTDKQPADEADDEKPDNKEGDEKSDGDRQDDEAGLEEGR